MLFWDFWAVYMFLVNVCLVPDLWLSINGSNFVKQFKQCLLSLHIRLGQHQIRAVIPMDLGNLLNTLGTFLASSSSFRNAAKSDCSWNQRSMITIETVRIFGGSNNFKSVIQMFISIFEILWWVLAFLWYVMDLKNNKNNSSGGFGLEKCGFDRKIKTCVRSSFLTRQVLNIVP